MIIRRNPDGSIIEEQATQQSHPALTTRRGMAHYLNQVEQYLLCSAKSLQR